MHTFTNNKGEEITRRARVNIGADGRPSFEPTNRPLTIQPNSNNNSNNANWGDRLKGDYEKGTPAWKRASDEDFFGVANLPPQFLSALKDPQFRKDMEAYEMAVRSGDVSVTGKRQELYDKLKDMGVPMGALTDKTRDMDTYLKPEIFKAIEVANRDPKLIPQNPEQTTTRPNPQLNVSPVPPTSDEDEDASPDPRARGPETFRQPPPDPRARGPETFRQPYVVPTSKYEPERTDYLDTGSTDTAMSGGGVGNLDYSNIMNNKGGLYSNLTNKNLGSYFTQKGGPTRPGTNKNLGSYFTQKGGPTRPGTNKNLGSYFTKIKGPASSGPNAALKVKPTNEPKLKVNDLDSKQPKATGNIMTQIFPDKSKSNPESDKELAKKLSKNTQWKQDGVYRNQSFSQSFKDARKKHGGDGGTFQWQNPNTGKISKYTTNQKKPKITSTKNTLKFPEVPDKKTISGIGSNIIKQ